MWSVTATEGLCHNADAWGTPYTLSENPKVWGLLLHRPRAVLWDGAMTWHLLPGDRAFQLLAPLSPAVLLYVLTKLLQKVLQNWCIVLPQYAIPLNLWKATYRREFPTSSPTSYLESAAG